MRSANSSRGHLLLFHRRAKARHPDSVIEADIIADDTFSRENELERPPGSNGDEIIDVCALMIRHLESAPRE